MAALARLPELPAPGASQKALRRFRLARKTALDGAERAWEALFAPEAGTPVTAEEESLCERLDRALGASLHTGLIQPAAFDSESANFAYARKRFARRARCLVDALLHESCAPALLRSLFAGRGAVDVVSVGGGPGSDFAACALVASLAPGLTGDTGRPPLVRCRVFDFAAAWGPCVDAVESALGGEGRGHVSLELCDVTAGAAQEENARLLWAVERAQLTTFCYVLNENEAALAEPAQGPPRLAGAVPGLLGAVAEGAAVVALDASGRLWPALAETAEAIAPGCWRGWALHSHAHQHGLVLQRAGPEGAPALREQLREAMEVWSAQYDLYSSTRRPVAEGGHDCSPRPENAVPAR